MFFFKRKKEKRSHTECVKQSGSYLSSNEVFVAVWVRFIRILRNDSEGGRDAVKGHLYSDVYMVWLVIGGKWYTQGRGRHTLSDWERKLRCETLHYDTYMDKRLAPLVRGSVWEW